MQYMTAHQAAQLVFHKFPTDVTAWKCHIDCNKTCNWWIQNFAVSTKCNGKMKKIYLNFFQFLVQTAASWTFFFFLQSENCQRVFTSFSLEKSSLRTSKRFLFDQVSRRLFHSIKVHWMKQLELTLISDQNFTLKHEPTESCLQFPESSFL